MIPSIRLLVVLAVIVWSLLCGVTGAIIDRVIVNHKLDVLIVDLKAMNK